MHRHHRRLDRERDEEADEQPASDVLVRSGSSPARRAGTSGAGAGRHDVQADDRGQHQQAAEQREEQELHRGVGAARAAEAADQEVDRDQRRLEQDVEEEHVGRGEDADREALERQHPGEERVDAPATLVAVVPRGEDDHRRQDRGEQHQRQPDAVDAERVVGAERADPLVVLGELEARAAGVEADRDDRDDDQRHQRDAERDHLGQVGPTALGQHGHDHRADDRQQQGRGQQGKAVHCDTASACRGDRGAAEGLETSVPGRRSRGSLRSHLDQRLGPLMRGSPPAGPGRPAGHRPGPRARRTGRTRSAPVGTSGTSHRTRRRCR